jgi:hypothetical protein
MRTIVLSLFALTTLAGAAAPARAQMPAPDAGRVLNLAFDADGRVTLSARNVTVRDILGEWARQCGCYVVNADRLPGGPLPIPLLYEHETQGKVLESLLRQAAGYVLTPQKAGAAGRSNFETIYILATSAAVAAPYTPTPASAFPMPTAGAPDDELPPVVPAGVLRPPVGGPPVPQPPGAPQVPGLPPPGAEPPQGQTSLPSSRPSGTMSTFVPIRPAESTPTTPPAAPPGSPASLPPGTVPPPVPVGMPVR